MMTRRLALAALVVTLASAAPVNAQPTPATTPTPTARDAAAAFVAKVEAELGPLNEFNARTAWVGSNYITEDTMWLRARARSEMSRLQVGYALDAAVFDHADVEPSVRRKLDILKRRITLPSPR